MNDSLKEVRYHFVKVAIKTNNNISLIQSLNRMNINIYEVDYGNKKLLLKITYDDYKKLKKYYKCSLVKHYNIYGYKDTLKRMKIYYLAIVIFIVLTFLLSRLILEVKVIHTNPLIRELILRDLKDYSIKKYTIKKDFNTLEEIKNEIVNNNKDQIEWLSIENVGMKYIIRVEERIINKKEENNKYCNLVATKDGLVKSFNISKGDALISNNMNVKKGDILVTGAIKFNEEVKNNVCADGKVYANTWYTVNIKISSTYQENVKTGAKRFNMSLKTKDNSYLIFRPRLNNYVSEDKRLLSIMGNSLYFTTDYEVKTETKKYTEEELDKLIEDEVNNKMKTLLKSDYEIVTKKVLKKELNDSIIDIDVFVVVLENIAEVQEYTIEEKIEEQIE